MGGSDGVRGFHPEFDRIRATLAEAAASGSRIWLANRMHLVEGVSEI
jgi:hypothetical protein